MARTDATHGTRETTHTLDGQLIIAREHNTLAPHPNPVINRALVPTKGVNRLLVESSTGATEDESRDGIELFECDACGKTFSTPTSVISHMPTHNPAKTDPITNIDVIKQVIRTVNRYKSSKVKDYCDKAAAELNTLRVPTSKGVPWSATGVSSVYNRWINDPRVKRSRSTTPSLTPSSTSLSCDESPVKPRTNSAQPMSESLAQFKEAMEMFATNLANVTQQFARLLLEVEKLPVADEVAAELRAKAERYDQLKNILS